MKDLVLKAWKHVLGQGRKPIMNCSDEESVRKVIEEDRQSVSKVREAWERLQVKKPATSPSNVF